jgi:tetratricopeptide (TPR) repeat protein
LLGGAAQNGSIVAPVPKLLWRLSGIILVLATSGCFVFGTYPTTWEGRYKKALDDLRAAPNDIGRFYALADAAKAAFEVGETEKARAHAQEALDLASRFRDDWNYGNAIHDGHMVLGRIALRNGDVETAKRELVEAGRTPGSPQLNSFGPNMSLARDLLERKETDAVTTYFALCTTFWKLERGNLGRWSALAKAGEIPDFGANLFY